MGNNYYTTIKTPIQKTKKDIGKEWRGGKTFSLHNTHTNKQRSVKEKGGKKTLGIWYASSMKSGVKWGKLYRFRCKSALNWCKIAYISVIWCILAQSRI